MDAAQALAEKVLQNRARRHPSWATLAGLPGRDHELRDSSRAAIEAEAAEIQALLHEAEALPPTLDREALLTHLRLELFELRETRSWARNPDVATEYFDHLFSLLLAAHLAPEERAAALVARLDGCAAFFADAWARVEAADVPPLWVEGAKQSLAGAKPFFDAVREAAGGPGVDAAIARAQGVLDAHARWLAALQPRGAVALGRARFEALLRARRIDETPEGLIALGERLVARFRSEMEEAAGTVLAAAGKDPGDDPVAEALALVKQDHPRSFADVLAAYRRSIAEAREAVERLGLAAVPDVPLDVVETPAFLRHLIPFAAYVPPARFATPRRGVYLVTPKADLSAFPNADTRNVTVHEAYPGHHLQLSIAAERASLAAFLCETPDLTEGWALYCEWLMGAHGYTAAPADRLIRARDARWRATRIVLDVSLHAGAMTPEQASARLAAETGMGREEADAEVLRYTQAPAYNLSYMWGRLRIEALRERALAAGRSERALHDALLAVGSLPVTLVEDAVASKLGLPPRARA
jgi:uncharacterized protein (DUF885 family)